MIINRDSLVKSLNYLSMAVSKTIVSKNSEKLLLLESKGDTVYGYTCDSINNIRVEIGKSTDDFYALVEFASFFSSIKSCEGDITLETKGKFIQIKASNVKCKLPTYNHEVKRDATGIPDPTNNYTYTNKLTDKIELGILKTIIDPNHPVEIYKKIYFGDYIVVSDTDNVLRINKKIFTEDIILNVSSVEILNNLSNIEYTYINDNGIRKLAVKSDELYAVFVITENTNNDYQYTDFIDLFNSVAGSNIIIDSTVLAKAMSAAAMFKTTPKIVFNPKGVFLQIDNVEFIYKISDKSCEDHIYELPADLVKKITVIGKDITLYYTNDDLLRCDCGNIHEILSAKELKTNES